MQIYTNVIQSKAMNLEYIKWMLPRSFASLWMTISWCNQIMTHLLSHIINNWFSSLRSMPVDEDKPDMP